MSDQGGEKGDSGTLHVGIVLTGVSGHRVDARYIDTDGAQGDNNSIYGDELVEVKEYDDDELLASLSFMLADAVARRCFPADGQPAATEVLAKRYAGLCARVLAGVDRLPVPADQKGA
jgi:hypothetical protein